MKILQLTKKFPYPIKDGEVIAIHNLSSSYKALGAELTLLCMNTPKHYFKIEDLPADYQVYKSIHAVDVDSSVKPISAFLNLFTSESYHISRFDSPAYHEKLTNILQKETFDIIQLETLFLTPYINTIRKYSKAKIVLRAHNIEHEIWERITKNTIFAPKRWYLKLLSRRLAIYEKEQLNNCDLLLPITQRDLNFARQFGFNKKGLVTPIGLDAADYQVDNSSFQKQLSLSFIGSLDWMPNVEGLNWFLDKIWTTAKEKHPTISLHLAGRNTPDSLYNLESDQLKVLGEIPDAKAFINAHSLMLVPLLSGSGMRVKILEGMALGKVVLSTTVGLEGIIGKHKEEFLVADTPEEFMAALDYCYKNPEAMKRIGEAARKVILEEYDNGAIAGRVLEDFGDME
jgi:glycosyltransferase involved in cell wall biosynthesis